MGAKIKKGSSRVRHTKTEKIKALIYLESMDFSYTKTAQKFDISISTIKRWREEYANEAFGVKPRNDIAVQKKNQIELLAISNLKVETIKANASAKAAHELLERLSDPERLKKIGTETLIKIAALYKEEAPAEAPREIDIIRQRMEQFAKRQSTKDGATDTQFTVVEERRY